MKKVVNVTASNQHSISTDDQRPNFRRHDPLQESDRSKRFCSRYSAFRDDLKKVSDVESMLNVDIILDRPTSRLKRLGALRKSLGTNPKLDILVAVSIENSVS